MVDLTATKLTIAELYTFILTNGVIARFTSCDVNITYGGNTYQAIPIKRTNISYHSQLQVDKVTITAGIIGITIGAQSYTIPQIIKRDSLRGAHIYIYLIDYIALDSLKLMFEGWVTGGISYDQGSLIVECGSLLDKLNEKFPRLIYSEFCQHRLFDTYCSLTKASYKTSGSATAGTTTQLIYASCFQYATKPKGYWLSGELKLTSGNNNGLSRTINLHGDGYVRVINPFIDSIVVDDTFDVYPGCDKSGSICESKFSNYENFFGFEFIPNPDVLYG